MKDTLEAIKEKLLKEYGEGITVDELVELAINEGFSYGFKIGYGACIRERVRLDN